MFNHIRDSGIVNLSLSRGAPRHLLELVVIVGAYFVYQVIGKFGIPNVETVAYENAFKIISFESAIGLFWEQRWQGWALENARLVIIFLNGVYTFGYWPIIFTTAIVMYIKDRPTYAYYRNIVLLSFFLALIAFSALPLAPPRFLPEYGFVNTLELFGPSIYGSRDMAPYYNLFAAMPSLHFGWTLLVGVYLLRRTKYIWLKVFGVVYPTVTFFAITLTANHYIIDALGGGAVIIGAYLLYGAFLRMKPRLSLALASAKSAWQERRIPSEMDSGERP